MPEANHRKIVGLALAEERTPGIPREVSSRNAAIHGRLFKVRSEFVILQRPTVPKSRLEIDRVERSRSKTMALQRKRAPADASSAGHPQRVVRDALVETARSSLGSAHMTCHRMWEVSNLMKVEAPVASFDDNDVPAGPGQFRGHNYPRRPASDDTDISPQRLTVERVSIE